MCYVDSMKLLLNLYGHKLPVLSFDISSDNNLLATGSADKNLKIWGMQFGDIHKSIFCHSDSITCVKFIKDTHYVLTASKDKEVKMIDCDTYDEVFVFDSFFGEVWSLTVSSIGDYFVAVSADRGIRIWKQSSEQSFVTDEQEYRQEKQMLKDAEAEFQEIDIARANQVDPFAKDKVVKIETEQVTKRSAETIKYGDDLIFAIELADKWREEVDQFSISADLWIQSKKQGTEPERPKPSIHFLGRTIFDHVLLKLKAIRNSDLESSLRFLNYQHSMSLVFYCEHWLRNVSLVFPYHLEYRNRLERSLRPLHRENLPNANPAVRQPRFSQVAKDPYAAPLRAVEGRDRHEPGCNADCGQTDGFFRQAGLRHRTLCVLLRHFVN